MANEITIQASMQVANGNLKIDWRPSQDSVDQAAARGGNPGTVNVGTTYEALSFGDLAALGYCGMQNLDSTNYVEVGVEVSAAFYPVIKLKAGELALFRLVDGVSYFARANTAAVNLHICAVNN